MKRPLGAHRRLSLTARRSGYGLLFISPFIIGTLLFFAFPIYRSLELSFSEFENVSQYQLNFVGLQHYANAFIEDARFTPMFLETIKKTLIHTPLINIFALYVALLLNRKMPGRTIFRAVFFLPVVLGSGFVMQQLLNQGVDQEAMKVAQGILLPDQIRAYIGGTGVKLVQDFLNTITMIMWSSGVQIIIYLAALQGIPASLYEAAKVDAASPWSTFWLISLPMLAPMILLNLIYTVVDSFTDASNSLINYILDVGFKREGRLEYSAALSWIYFAFVILLIGVIFLVMRRFVRRVSES